MAGFDEVHSSEAGDRAVIVYEARTSTSKRFRNCEVYTIRNGNSLQRRSISAGICRMRSPKAGMWITQARNTPDPADDAIFR